MDSSISSSDEDDSDNDIEGAKVTSAKSGEDATDAKDQGNEAVNDSNTDLDGRDKVMTEVFEDTSTMRWGQMMMKNPPRTDRGSKRSNQERKPASTSAPKSYNQDFETGVQINKTKKRFNIFLTWFQKTYEKNNILSDPCMNTSVPAVHESVQPWLSNLAQQDPRESFDELTDSTFDFSAFCADVLRFYKATTEKLDWINPEGRQYPHDLRQPLPVSFQKSPQREDLVPNSMWSQTIVKYDRSALWGISHWGKKRRQFYAFATSRESARDVYSKRRIIAVTKVEIVEWHDYKHLDWITVRRDDDALYTFKEGDFHRLRIQDIEDSASFLWVQGKVTNLKSNLRRQDAYTPYSDPRGFIYENKDKKNRLMRIDELHKFSDGTLDDVRSALNDRLKGIRMGKKRYLPETFWNHRDKANARAMIQAIDKRLKTRRIMRSLERFVGGRPYGGDLRLLQRTI
ncbi:hypothetical protein Tco_0531346 [Tanacetum coccineum]